jgi:hypothetical protein
MASLPGHREPGPAGRGAGKQAPPVGESATGVCPLGHPGPWFWPRAFPLYSIRENQFPVWRSRYPEKVRDGQPWTIREFRRKDIP